MLSLCKVTDSLFISNARSACAENLLAREGVTFCINVSRQQPFPDMQPGQTLRVPVFDDPSEDLYKYFERCSAAIERTIHSGGKCLVYCKNGRSRSAAICTAYLMKHHKLSLQDAFEVLGACRNQCQDCEDRQASSRAQCRILVSITKI
ncbi:dual specificity phosphatase 28 isoform X2 [Sphaerodactylus townsendi]|uniref:dual specificity phosphatase 28 isoform X2 n=1 Tax=Sphaerodactylus townsendi TaxID=933632 RepID=UPI00202740F0|nr:dual specificity phosphatase 28 isoform X2 [Sphaerodactylus townsendi]